MFNKALKALPSNVGYDPGEHTTVSDLLYIVQHELDLMNEEPEQYEHMSAREFNKLSNQYKKFIVRFSKEKNSSKTKYTYVGKINGYDFQRTSTKKYTHAVVWVSDNNKITLSESASFCGSFELALKRSHKEIINFVGKDLENKGIDWSNVYTDIWFVEWSKEIAGPKIPGFWHIVQLEVE